MTNQNLQAITFTIIFEANALNRDEKIGGNMPSIKKLIRVLPDGKSRTFSFISRESIRHHLFYTLHRLNGDRWKKTLTPLKGDVAQFDLSRANILDFAEIDAFGYLYTVKTQSSITRKATVGITKAIALEHWNGDMQFNANHDMAKRSESTPNPVQKEEHMSYFKVSFTIDIARMGKDEWLVNKKLKFDDKKNSLPIIFEEKSQKGAIEGLEKTDVENKYKLKDKGSVEIVNDNKVGFELDHKEKKARITDIMRAIKSGLIFAPSGENWGVEPKFIIAAGLELPVPLFQSYIELNSFNKNILDNDYIVQNGDKKLLFIDDNMNLQSEDDKAESMNWEDFKAKILEMIN